jgi:formylglycine-generating enzyme required for sulfatase activity
LGAWLALALYPEPGIAASEGDRVAGPYIQSTVRINGPGGDGFGFIVGEKAGRLYLVTADHVVSGPDAPVQVFFQQDRTEPVEAQVLVHSPRDALDTAVLKVRKPAGLAWTPRTYCPSLVDPAFERGERVWFMRHGRGGRWAPALDNEAGSMRDSEPSPTDRIAFSGIGVQPGVSGSPLIARNGIIGMVIQDQYNDGVAVEIEKIRRLVEYYGGHWGLSKCATGDAEQVAVARSAPVVPSTRQTAAPSCWDDRAHKQVCRDPMQSGGEGPAMVVLAGGKFRMGSESAEADSDEKPVHEVTVAPFALAKHELTKGEFARFVKAEGYQTDAEKGDGCYGWTGDTWEKKQEFNWNNVGFEQGDDHPVVCVSWKDANAYLDWLSAETGERYRLPTESEWEYAVRGGTRDERFWGNDPDDACEFANVRDESAKQAWGAGSIHDCDDQFAFTAPVGSFKPNGFGLYDGLGNVLPAAEQQVAAVAVAMGHPGGVEAGDVQALVVDRQRALPPGQRLVLAEPGAVEGQVGGVAFEQGRAVVLIGEHLGDGCLRRALQQIGLYGPRRV